MRVSLCLIVFGQQFLIAGVFRAKYVDAAIVGIFCFFLQGEQIPHEGKDWPVDPDISGEGKCGCFGGGDDIFSVFHGGKDAADAVGIIGQNTGNLILFGFRQE